MKRNAFTLVELSIVLVILGLLIGGVLTGQTLIRASELRSITTQQSRFVTATQTFRDKYFALPGDMTNAQSYWGIAHATPATCAATASSNSLTCNGDGNGQVSNTTGSNEHFRFWQHLANAGLIEGSYDGITHGSSTTSVTIENAPAGRISSTLWHIFYWAPISSSNDVFDGNYENSFQFGGMKANSSPMTAVLKPEEAYNIDTKTDDGKPGTGKIVTRTNTSAWNTQTCSDGTGGANLTANYLLSSTVLSCALIFRQQF